MGFFNAMSSIGKINNLLKDFENQVTISQDLVISSVRADLQSARHEYKHLQCAQQLFCRLQIRWNGQK